MTGKQQVLSALFKLMTAGKPGAKGTSLMEDYTYHLEPGKEAILQAHMLEICPSTEGSLLFASTRLQWRTRGSRPPCLYSEAGPRHSLLTVDPGKRFRMIVNEANAYRKTNQCRSFRLLPPLWRPLPDFATGTEGCSSPAVLTINGIYL